jgi:hypothetical protein
MVSVMPVPVVLMSWPGKVKVVADNSTLDCVPVPFRGTSWVPPGALSTISNRALKVPVVDGVNVTLTLQVLEAPLVVNLAPEQVSAVLEKSLTFVPPITTSEMARVAEPLLVTVSVIAGLAVFSIWVKFKLAEERPTIDCVPVPIIGIDWELPGPLSVKFSEALRLPVEDGVNVTLTLQEPPEITDAPVQVSVPLEKSLAFVPLIATNEMPRLPVPLLVTVSVRAELVVLMGWPLKFNGEVENPTAGSVPVPVKATVWGLKGALSVKLSVAPLPPVAVGVNVTWTVQVLFGATDAPVQVSELLAKSPGSTPPTATDEMLRLAAPVLVTVSVIAELIVPTGSLGKFKLGAEKPTKGCVPVPPKVTAWGLPEALSVKLREALRFPVAEGVKVTLTVQVLFGATVAPVQESAPLVKSPAFTPLMATDVIVRPADPVLVTVSVCAELVVLIGWLTKSRGEAEKLTMAAVPVPVKVTTCGGPVAPLLVMVTVSVPLLGPGAAGVKVTVIMQFPPTFTPPAQLSVSEKAPVVEMATVIGTLPVFVRVSVCPPLVVPGDWLLKVRLPRETPVEMVIPVPKRLIVCAVVEAEVMTDSVPVRNPLAVGVKDKLKTQPAPMAKDDGQLLVWAKSPLIFMAVMLMAPPPLFTKFAVWVELV